MPEGDGGAPVRLGKIGHVNGLKLLGGWLATKLFHVVTLHGFFNLSTWLTAIAGAAILLLAYHLLNSRSAGRSRSRSGRSRRWAHR